MSMVCDDEDSWCYAFDEMASRRRRRLVGTPVRKIAGWGTGGTIWLASDLWRCMCGYIGVGVLVRTRKT